MCLRKILRHSIKKGFSQKLILCHSFTYCKHQNARGFIFGRCVLYSTMWNACIKRSKKIHIAMLQIALCCSKVSSLSFRPTLHVNTRTFIQWILTSNLALYYSEFFLKTCVRSALKISGQVQDKNWDQSLRRCFFFFGCFCGKKYLKEVLSSFI